MHFLAGFLHHQNQNQTPAQPPSNLAVGNTPAAPAINQNWLRLLPPEFVKDSKGLYHVNTPPAVARYMRPVGQPLSGDNLQGGINNEFYPDNFLQDSSPGYTTQAPGNFQPAYGNGSQHTLPSNPMLNSNNATNPILNRNLTNYI